MAEGKEKQRNSNFELLRILAMILIVMHHYSVHGFVQPVPVTMNKLIVDGFAAGGKVGVDIFVMISGYFMINSRLTIRKLLKLWGQIWFYSICLFFLLNCVLKPGASFSQITLTNVVPALFPVLSNEYGFVTSFILLMLFSPALNLMIHKLKQEQIKIIVVAGLVISAVLPIISFSTSQTTLENLWIFVFLYILAAYIRLYYQASVSSAKHFVLAILLYIVLLVFNVSQGSFMQSYSILVIGISAELLIGFSMQKPHYSPWINIIASASFGVYLIHDNPNVRSYLWETLLDNQGSFSSGYMIIYACLSVLAVYAVCTVIDLLRKNTAEKLWMTLVDHSLLSCCEDMLHDSMNLMDSLHQAFIRKWKGQKFFLSGKIRQFYGMTSIISAALILFSVSGHFAAAAGAQMGNTEKIYQILSYLVWTLYMYTVLQLILFYIVYRINIMGEKLKGNSSLWEWAAVRLLIWIISAGVIYIVCRIPGYTGFIDAALNGNSAAVIVYFLLLLCGMLSFSRPDIHFKS